MDKSKFKKPSEAMSVMLGESRKRYQNVELVDRDLASVLNVLMTVVAEYLDDHDLQLKEMRKKFFGKKLKVKHL